MPAKHVIAVTGAGGKTTAMGVLARQCRERSVLVTTTTHMYPMSSDSCDRCVIDPNPGELVSALSEPGVVCAGRAAPQGKLTILPEEVLCAGFAAADVVLYEGDGSRGLPLKLHRKEEPVLLPGTTSCLVVAGLSALGKPVVDAVHRPELAPALGENSGGCVDANVFLHCVLETVDSIGCSVGQMRVFLNQEDSCREKAQIREIRGALQLRGLAVKSGNLHSPPDDLYEWIVSG